jgi:glutamyl-tRNA synthetase/glutamyl-Q tRNA(Asp) synthetase
VSGTTRFAPAPTGHLHLGHVVNAIWVWGYARAHGHRILLRLEDHDRGRCRPEYEASILEDLDWLGLVPDGATTDDFRRGPHPQRQSDNRARYDVALAALEATGLAYPCLCSRSDIASANEALGRLPVESEELHYPGTCRHRSVPAAQTLARRAVMPAGEKLRFDDLRLGPQAQTPALQCGDVLIRDRHGNYTYQFCVAVDDLDQSVDLIIRGEDLLESTGRQFALARMLGRSEMPRVLHHPLLRHSNGRKLSKAAGDTGLRELRAAGVTAEELLGRAAHFSGLQDVVEPLSAAELPRLFIDVPGAL